MKTPQEVYEEIIYAHQKLESIPEQLHLFCPKVDDDDEEDYDNADTDGDTIDAQQKKTRVEEAKARLQFTSWASLILGINREQADK